MSIPRPKQTLQALHDLLDKSWPVEKGGWAELDESGRGVWLMNKDGQATHWMPLEVYQDFLSRIDQSDPYNPSLLTSAQKRPATT